MEVMSLLYVAAGGACGALLRYGVATWLSRYASAGFPLATFAINIVGALLMGMWIACSTALPPAKARDLHLLIAIGGLGGFTTFSTFSLEFFVLLERGAYGSAAFYSVGSVIVSLLALMAGMWLMRWMVG